MRLFDSLTPLFNLEVQLYEFRDALQAQENLQISSYGGVKPGNLSNEEKIEFIRWNILALEDELHEALGEIGWKPWASSKHINKEALQSELVDAFHFLMNLMLVSEITADEFLAKYQAKREKNAKRQIDGYDGVSTKCPKCKRALDDTAVQCRISTDNDLLSFCENIGEFYALEREA